MSARLLGAVLAGGRSRRFGRDKTRERVGGTSLVERAAELLDGPMEAVVVVSSRASFPPWATIPDAREPCGPLGGIEAALLAAERRGFDGAFVLACDLPLVRAETVRAIVAGLGTHDWCAPGDGPRRIQPLCAAYSLACLTTVRALLADGTREAAALARTLHGHTVHVDPEHLLNVNTPDAAAEAERALGSRGD